METNFDLTKELRSELLAYLTEELERYYLNTAAKRVTPVLDLEKIIHAVRSFDLAKPVQGKAALKAVLEGMTTHAVHTPHPMYYGLYNPRANFAGILADLITAVFNPQLAAWSHSPYANEVEKYMVETFGLLFGYSRESIDGVFASGGAEANFTAILCALNQTFPQIGEKGLQSISKTPRIYCSEETHHSILKGARMAGLGTNSVKVIEVDYHLKMNADQLRETIKKDKKSGHEPVMVVATAGTTGTGSIDRLEELGEICNANGVWYHVDAAYGGATVLHPEFKAWIKGIESSQSLIVDLHKWCSVPMAASMFLTSETEILQQTFHIKTGYMPGDARDLQITDPFTHSFQWSRRFSGLKIYLSMLMYGMEGYSNIIEKHVTTGNSLRVLLKSDGWIIRNVTPLPVVCFTDDRYSHDPKFARTICDAVIQSGEAWISVYPLGNSEILRACITNYNTGDIQIKKLVKLLAKARDCYGS